MAKTKLGFPARNASAYAVRALLQEGGSVRLRAAPWGKGEVLAEQTVDRLAHRRAATAEAGRIVLARFEATLALRTGDPAWAQVIQKDGTVVLECDVGGLKSKAALQLEPLRVFAHGTVEGFELYYTQPE